MSRVLDQAAELTTLPSAGNVWWVDDDDVIRDENRLRVDPHQALRRIRELQVTATVVTGRRITAMAVIWIGFGLAFASCVYNLIIWWLS